MFFLFLLASNVMVDVRYFSLLILDTKPRNNGNRIDMKLSVFLLSFSWVGLIDCDLSSNGN